MTDRIRLTISVTPEVHEVFSLIATMGGVSLGRSMGDWLNDTLEGAQFVAVKMQEAREAPSKVMRELHAQSAGIEDQRAKDLASIGIKVPRRAAAAAPRSGAAVAARPPRPVIRGESPSVQQALDLVRRGKKP